LELEHIERIDSNDHTFRAHVILHQRWHDNRLTHSSVGNYLVVPTDKLWKPEVHLHTVDHTVRESRAKVSRTGEISLEQRMHVVTSCPMELSNFPFDVQRCPLMVYAPQQNPGGRQELVWDIHERHFLNHKPMLATGDFIMVDRYTEPCGVQSGTCLSARMVLARNVSDYLIRIYIPLAMTVLISLMGYWVNSSPIRVTLLMFDLTIGVFLVHTCNLVQPQAGYSKSVDCYTGISLMFLFVAIFEFVVVHFIYKRELLTDKIHAMMNDLRTNMVDRVCRLLMPILYIVFLMIYVYISWADRSEALKNS